MSRTCEDCKWMRDDWGGMNCLFSPVLPKSAEIKFFPVSVEDKTECPTWEPEQAAKPSNSIQRGIPGGEA